MQIEIASLVVYGLSIFVLGLVFGFMIGSWYGEKVVESIIQEMRIRHNWEIIQLHKRYINKKQNDNDK